MDRHMRNTLIRSKFHSQPEIKISSFVYHIIVYKSTSITCIIIIHFVDYFPNSSRFKFISPLWRFNHLLSINTFIHKIHASTQVVA